MGVYAGMGTYANVYGIYYYYPPFPNPIPHVYNTNHMILSKTLIHTFCQFAEELISYTFL